MYWFLRLNCSISSSSLLKGSMRSGFSVPVSSSCFVCCDTVATSLRHRSLRFIAGYIFVLCSVVLPLRKFRLLHHDSIVFIPPPLSQNQRELSLTLISQKAVSIRLSPDGIVFISPAPVSRWLLAPYIKTHRVVPQYQNIKSKIRSSEHNVKLALTLSSRDEFRQSQSAVSAIIFLSPLPTIGEGFREWFEALLRTRRVGLL